LNTVGEPAEAMGSLTPVQKQEVSQGLASPEQLTANETNVMSNPPLPLRPLGGYSNVLTPSGLMNIQEQKANFEASLSSLPQNIQDLYRKGDIAGFNKAISDYNTQQKADFETKVLPNLPANLQSLYRTGDTTAFNKALSDYNTQNKASYEKNVLPNLPQNLQDIYKTGNTDAFNKALDAYNVQNKTNFEQNILPTLPQEIQNAYKSGGITALNAAIVTYNQNVANSTQGFQHNPTFDAIIQKYTTDMTSGQYDDLAKTQIQHEFDAWLAQGSNNKYYADYNLATYGGIGVGLGAKSGYDSFINSLPTAPQAVRDAFNNAGGGAAGVQAALNELINIGNQRNVDAYNLQQANLASLVSSVPNFKVGSSYDIYDALQHGITPTQLVAAGFNIIDISNARQNIGNFETNILPYLTSQQQSDYKSGKLSIQDATISYNTVISVARNNLINNGVLDSNGNVNATALFFVGDSKQYEQNLKDAQTLGINFKDSNGNPITLKQAQDMYGQSYADRQEIQSKIQNGELIQLNNGDLIPVNTYYSLPADLQKVAMNKGLIELNNTMVQYNTQIAKQADLQSQAQAELVGLDMGTGRYIDKTTGGINIVNYIKDGQSDTIMINLFGDKWNTLKAQAQSEIIAQNNINAQLKPYTDANGNVNIVGFLYDHPELKDDLVAAGYSLNDTTKPMTPVIHGINYYNDIATQLRNSVDNIQSLLDNKTLTNTQQAALMNAYTQNGINLTLKDNHVYANGVELPNETDEGRFSRPIQIWGTLSDEQKQQIATTFDADKFKGNPFAEFINTTNIAGSKSFITSLVTSPISAIGTPIAKGTIGQKVSSMEIANAEVTAILLAIPFAGDVGVIGKAIQGAASGFFTYQTINNWGGMSNTQRGVSLAMDALLGVSALPDTVYTGIAKTIKSVDLTSEKGGTFNIGKPASVIDAVNYDEVLSGRMPLTPDGTARLTTALNNIQEAVANFNSEALALAGKQLIDASPANNIVLQDIGKSIAANPDVYLSYASKFSDIDSAGLESGLKLISDVNKEIKNTTTEIPTPRSTLEAPKITEPIPTPTDRLLVEKYLASKPIPDTAKLLDIVNNEPRTYNGVNTDVARLITETVDNDGAQSAINQFGLDVVRSIYTNMDTEGNIIEGISPVTGKELSEIPSQTTSIQAEISSINKMTDSEIVNSYIKGITDSVNKDGFKAAIDKYGADKVQAIYPDLTDKIIVADSKIRDYNNALIQSKVESPSQIKYNVSKYLTKELLGNTPDESGFKTLLSKGLVEQPEYGETLGAWTKNNPPDEITTRLAAETSEIQRTEGGGYKYINLDSTKPPYYSDNQTLLTRVLYLRDNPTEIENIIGGNPELATINIPEKINELPPISSEKPQIEVGKVINGKITTVDGDTSYTITDPIVIVRDTETTKINPYTPEQISNYEEALNMLRQRMKEGLPSEISEDFDNQLRKYIEFKNTQGTYRLGTINDLPIDERPVSYSTEENFITGEPETRQTIILKGLSSQEQYDNLVTDIKNLVNEEGFNQALKVYGLGLVSAVYPFAAIYAINEKFQQDFPERSAFTGTAKPIAPTQVIDTRTTVGTFNKQGQYVKVKQTVSTSSSGSKPYELNKPLSEQEVQQDLIGAPIKEPIKLSELGMQPIIKESEIVQPKQDISGINLGSNAPAPTPAPVPNPIPQPQPNPNPIPPPTPNPIPPPIPPEQGIKEYENINEVAPIEQGKTQKIAPQVSMPTLTTEEIPKELRNKPATWEWRSGYYWEAVPPPYDKAYHLTKPLPGTYKFATGRGSAYKTLQVLYGVPTQDVDLNLGWTNVHIDHKKRTMTFGGGKEAADERWAEQEQKMSELERMAYENMPENEVSEKIPRGLSHSVAQDLGKIELLQYRAVDPLNPHSYVHTYAVNDDYVRQFLDENMNFQAGHHWSHEFIPKNEIWIGKDIPDKHYYFVHEFEERPLMADGMPYDEAHGEYANELEKEVRTNPYELSKTLREITSRKRAVPKRENTQEEVEEYKDDYVVVPSYVRKRKGLTINNEDDGYKIATLRYHNGKLIPIVI
jgi:cation transport regulator ChaB